MIESFKALFCRDYRPQPELDVLSASGIDDEDVSELSFSARRAAEREMNERDDLEDEDAVGIGLTSAVV